MRNEEVWKHICKQKQVETSTVRIHEKHTELLEAPSSNIINLGLTQKRRLNGNSAKGRSIITFHFGVYHVDIISNLDVSLLAAIE